VDDVSFDVHSGETLALNATFELLPE